MKKAHTRDTRAKIARVKNRHTPKHKRKKRVNPAYGKDFVGAFAPETLADTIGNLMIPIMIRQLGFRGRDVLSVFAALFEHRKPDNKTDKGDLGTMPPASGGIQ